MSPSPTEVYCSTALKHPDKNRGDKYLPGEKTNTPSIMYLLLLLAVLVEVTHTDMRGEQQDYFHVTTVNVRIYHYTKSKLSNSNLR